MRPLSFDPPALRKHLLRHKIATLPELKSALGTTADLTVFRKLKLLDYLSSYTHRGRYYALREAARFDNVGLWSHEAVWFSRYGTLVSTIESFVKQSSNGWFADELADVLHAEVQDPLHDLVRADRLRRSEVAGRFLYTSADGRQARDQLRTRQTAQSAPLLTDASALQVPPEELKTAILLFYSLLDEQQRRLFAGLESIKLGHGGDGVRADPYNRDLYYGPDHYVPHLDKLNFVVDLPAGKGRKFLNHGGPLDYAFGGWTLSGLGNLYQGGGPLTVSWSASTLPEPGLSSLVRTGSEREG